MYQRIEKMLKPKRRGHSQSKESRRCEDGIPH